MADHSRITWTDATWNPVTGCSRVSEGCQHCYAEAWSHRFRWTRHPWTVLHSVENVQCHPDRLSTPLRWQAPRRVFVNSMADLFHDRVPDFFLDEVFFVMAQASRHIFQVLTKRPGRMYAYLTDPKTPRRAAAGWRWPLPNVWLGVSVENQRWANVRLPWLYETPGALRFVSAEPLLGPIDLTPWLDRLDWVIVGAESGPGARPMDDAWVRALRDQCQAAGVAFFFKQRADARGRKQIHPVLDGRTWESWPPGAG